ncbi:GroES-like protein [Coprinellus micaceus]|uniref:GroES-like protein n=1 Tax=Coprinellus micaceus TaxID=71717 RepID=A0A4Y7THH7_COPMI|nr:GroES-like protein [Coprinellus micaceus]
MSPTQQKALQLKERFGPYALADVPVPKPGKGEVLLKIHSAALNPVDWKLQKYGFFLETYPATLGSDIAGEVIELGDGVTELSIGDKVFTQGIIGDNNQSGFQQYATADAATVAKLPSNLTYDDVSTIPVAFTAPYVGLYNVSPHGLGFDTPVRPENRGKYRGVPIVVLGGSSAVGYFTLQLARLSGFSPIITTASARHESSLTAAGATHVLDRNAPVTKAKIQAITTSPIKTVVDAISNAETQRQGFEILSSGGKQLLVLQPESFWESEGKEQDKTGVQVTGSKRYPQHADLAKELYKKFTGLLENGDIKPHNVEVLPGGLNGIADGLKRLEEGKVSNTKLVSRPQEPQ